MKLQLIIPAQPQGKSRPRVVQCGKFTHAYTPQKTKDYEKLILDHFLALNEDEDKFPLFDKKTPVFISIFAFFSLPKSDFNKKGVNKKGEEKLKNKFALKKPDIDNIAKIVLDALNGYCYEDDSQVAGMFLLKQWTSKEPRLEIIIEDTQNPE